MDHCRSLLLSSTCRWDVCMSQLLILNRCCAGFWGLARAWCATSHGGPGNGDLSRTALPDSVRMSMPVSEQERLDPYIADVRLTTNQSLIEIDGILAFVTAGSQSVRGKSLTRRVDCIVRLSRRAETSRFWVSVLSESQCR